jgi:hypothetical protein
MHPLIAVAWTLTFSFPTVGAELPLEVKGVPLEGTEESIFAKYPKPKAGCVDMKANPFTDRFCGAADSFGGAEARIRFSLLKGKIRRISIELDSKDFEKVLEALLQKYGSPKTKSSETVTNAMGAQFENVLVVWDFGSQRIFARRFTDNIRTSSVSYSVADDEQFRQRLDEDKQRRAKDL